MQELLDRGGFRRVLDDIFNPNELKALELDSVYQIQRFTKEFYDRKNRMSQDLI